MNKNTEVQKKIISLLQTKNRIALFSHISPDGDTIGSGLALYLALKSLGKEVALYCDGTPPLHLSMLSGYEDIITEGKSENHEVSVAIDCADEKRVGGNIGAFHAAADRIVIDHHMTNEGFGDINWIDAEAAATSELIFQLVDAMLPAIPLDVATCLYTALISDTGNFAYSNTRAFSFAMTARLVEIGVETSSIVRKLFSVKTPSRMRMMSVCINQMKYYNGGSIAICVLDRQLISQIMPQSGDFDGMVEMIRDQEGVEVAILAREVVPSVYKVSFRSVQLVNVAQVAQKWQGGGHARAAACQISGSNFYDIGRRLLAGVQEAMR